MDRRTYKTTTPTCHDFCSIIDQRVSQLLIGFSAGQIQLIDMYRADVTKFYNQDVRNLFFKKVILIVNL